MVLDTSAIVAVLIREPAGPQYFARIATESRVYVGSATLVECIMVLSSRIGANAWPALATFLEDSRAEVVDFRFEHFEAAREAFLRYGKGRHPAALNFGDCLSYAIARVAGLPLLATGNDFSRTDIELA